MSAAAGRRWQAATIQWWRGGPATEDCARLVTPGGGGPVASGSGGTAAAGGGGPTATDGGAPTAAKGDGPEATRPGRRGPGDAAWAGAGSAAVSGVRRRRRDAGGRRRTVGGPGGPRATERQPVGTRPLVMLAGGLRPGFSSRAPVTSPPPSTDQPRHPWRPSPRCACMWPRPLGARGARPLLNCRGAIFWKS